MRRLEIAIGDARGAAVMLDGEAPRTCEIIWRALPLQGGLRPTIVGGAEVFLTVPDLAGVPPENQTIYPIPGDLTFYLQPADYVYWKVPGHERHVQSLGFVYGRDTQIYGPVMPLPLNLFATVSEGLPSLAAEIGRMKREGFGTMTLSRLR